MVSPATPSFACFMPPSVPANCVLHFSPAAPPLLSQSLLHVCLSSDVTAGAAVSATGLNDVSTDMGQKGGAQKSNFFP